MANRKLKKGDVIHLNHEVLHNGEYSMYFNGYPQLFDHKTWVVVQVDPKIEDRTVVRLRPLAKSHIAMTGRVCLESDKDEYTYDAFLSATYKATHK